MIAARRTHLTLLGLLLAGVLTFLLATAPPDARAASCSSARPFTLGNTVAWTSGYLRGGCNDGQLHVSGTVTDRLCDSKSVYVTFAFYTWRNDKYAVRSTQVGGGCGASLSYDHAAPPWSGSSMFKRVDVCIYAANFWGASSMQCLDYML